MTEKEVRDFYGGDMDKIFELLEWLKVNPQAIIKDDCFNKAVTFKMGENEVRIGVLFNDRLTQVQWNLYVRVNGLPIGGMSSDFVSKEDRKHLSCLFIDLSSILHRFKDSQCNELSKLFWSKDYDSIEVLINHKQH
jgi:hypothetical protein